MGLTSKLSTLSLGLYTFYFENPGSTTYTMPSIVREVSAIFVEITHFLPGIPLEFGPGAFEKIYCYCYEGSVLYSGTTSMFPTVSPSFWHSSLT
jgi:hypothetical protein